MALAFVAGMLAGGTFDVPHLMYKVIINRTNVRALSDYYKKNSTHSPPYAMEFHFQYRGLIRGHLILGGFALAGLGFCGPPGLLYRLFMLMGGVVFGIPVRLLAMDWRASSIVETHCDMYLAPGSQDITKTYTVDEVFGTTVIEIN
jgi:hypothetical protein